jgi:uncharacterized integral membrane protein
MPQDPQDQAPPADETTAPDDQLGDEPAAAADGAGATPASRPAKDPLRRSRASGTWIAVVALLVIVIVLAVFVLQNTQKVTISFFWWEGRAPLAAALLIATAGGLLLAVAAGSLRILQLRRRVKRTRRETK